jgi:hypothetical protein
MDEKKKEDIKHQVLVLLEDFSKKFQSIKISVRDEDIENIGDLRCEGIQNPGCADFKRLMLANAPKKNEDCIIAEKKSW